MIKVAIFASGSGSNFEALVRGSKEYQVELLICDQKEAYVLERAKNLKIKTKLILREDYLTKKEFEKKILTVLVKNKIEIIILAGYLRIIGKTILDQYQNRIINIHPSLLPRHPGLNGINDSYTDEFLEGGITIHYVDEGVDTGKIIFQTKIKKAKLTREEYEKEVHRVENENYPKVINELLRRNKMKKALISVSDKTGITEFAQELVALGYEIISTGGTKSHLDNSGIKTKSISEVTNFPEILDGRVKTLHPNVHAGLLALRDNLFHVKQIQEKGIEYIDLVCVNLYPFKETLLKEGITHPEIIEQIDIGGPSMLRSAAKNYRFVDVIVDPQDYKLVINEIKENQETSLEVKEYLAAKVFRQTASYDTIIAQYLSNKQEVKFPETLTITYDKVQDLRYGENPHQEAAFYKRHNSSFSLASGTQLQGKELSYNNIQDGNACISILKEFEEPCAVGVKHTNPCGVGLGKDANSAWDKAYAADKTSIFGGIVAFNREVNAELAKKLSEIFLEIIIAPEFSQEALEIFKKKPNLRIIQLDTTLPLTSKLTYTSIHDGILVQDYDIKELTLDDLEVVTETQVSLEDLKSMLEAWKIVKHVKSNAIVIYKDKMTKGIGAGQMNRVGAAKIAFEQAQKEAAGSIMASDAFFPMSDTVELAAKYKVKAIIQPGGSLKDKDSIEACNKHKIAMVFTKVRHFKH